MLLNSRLHADSIPSALTILFKHLPVVVDAKIPRCATKCAVAKDGLRTRLRRPWRGFVQRRANDVKLRMLILHCRFDILLAHGLHHELQVARLLQHASTKVVPATVKDQVLR